MSRGKVGLVKCEKCGRMVRRDKAVQIDKVLFQNPLNRNEVYDNEYHSMITRKVWYCPSCGKHLRVYEKKKKTMERQRERSEERQFRTFTSVRRPQVSERRAPAERPKEESEKKEEPKSE